VNKDGKADDRNIFMKGNKISVEKLYNRSLSITGENITFNGDYCFIAGFYGVLIGNNLDY
jgi:hypothetical protein